MPLKNRLVLVVRVPLTEGEMLPVPLIRTGGRSALTPAFGRQEMCEAAGRRGNRFELRARDAPRRRRGGHGQQIRVGRHLNRLCETADLQGHCHRARGGRLDDDAAADQALEAIELERDFVGS